MRVGTVGRRVSPPEIADRAIEDIQTDGGDLFRSPGKLTEHDFERNSMQISASPLPRRALLQRFGGGLGLIGAATALASKASAAVSKTTESSTAGPHFPATAKRVIHLFMNGGPFQADLFDPKPSLLKYAGQKPPGADLLTERPTGGLLPSPFRFRPRGESGVPVSELLPKLGAHIDDICVLRSMHADNPNHGPALLQMNNGTIIPTRPSMGSWFLYGLGTENQNLPGYVVLCPGRPVRFSILWNSAFLPSAHQGTYINHSTIAPDKMVPHLRNARWDRATQERQLELLQQLNAEHERRDAPTIPWRMLGSSPWKPRFACSFRRATPSI